MLSLNKAFVLRKIYGKNILMPVRSNQASQDPILLNDVATLIWEEVERNSQRENVIDAIIKIYGLSLDSPEVIAINSFIDQLTEMQVLVEEVE